MISMFLWWSFYSSRVQHQKCVCLTQNLQLSDIMGVRSKICKKIIDKWLQSVLQLGASGPGQLLLLLDAGISISIYQVFRNVKNCKLSRSCMNHIVRLWLRQGENWVFLCLKRNYSFTCVSHQSTSPAHPQLDQDKNCSLWSDCGASWILMQSQISFRNF